LRIDGTTALSGQGRWLPQTHPRFGMAMSCRQDGAGVGPGSSADDYDALGIGYPERWRRFDEAVRVLRALLHGDRPGSRASSTPPAGSGWLASAYNTTPDRFRGALDRLAGELARVGKAPASFPSAIATTWLHITEDKGEAERMVSGVLAPMLHRPAEALRSAPLLIGPAEVCAERLAAFVDAGARRVFVWPLADELRQLELFRERVTRLVPRQPSVGRA
jgi:alkanesulfonate monooxygenase SsuD/methylene tetrahydromethanopterin reductase-like flavin-dependent oxidoreductase (luciferase family)